MKSFERLCQDDRVKMRFIVGIWVNLHIPDLDDLWKWWMELSEHNGKDITHYGRLMDFAEWWGKTEVSKLQEIEYALLACILGKLDEGKKATQEHIDECNHCDDEMNNCGDN